MPRLFAALLILAMLAAGCGGADTREAGVPVATASPADEATAIVTASPQATEGGTRLTVGKPIDLPKDLALIVETGCWQCDGEPGGLVRVYRDASGRVIVDELRRGGYSLAAVPDASEMVAATCMRGDCGGLGPASADAQTTLLQSTDGGVTWRELGRRDGAYGLVGLAPHELVLNGPFDPVGQSNAGYELFPSGTRLQPPAGAQPQQLFAISRVAIVWHSSDAHRLLDADGRVVLDAGADHLLAYGNPVISAGGAIVTHTHLASDGEGTYTYAITVAHKDGGAAEHYLPPGLSIFGVWLTEDTLIGNADLPEEKKPPQSLGFFPAIIDLANREIRPIIQPFLEEPFFNGRNIVVAVQRGPFARVDTPGDCLRVRAEPRGDTVYDCAAHGVLLRDSGESRSVDGETWLRVTTPSGVEGWVSAQFVAR